MPCSALSRAFYIALILALGLLAWRPAAAATLTCTGTIETDLRATIDSAATNDVITLPANCVIQLTGAPDDDNNTSGDIDIAANTAATALTIEGAGAGSTIIDAGGIDRVFDIGAGKTVTLRNLTLRNGDGTVSAGTKDGGAIFFGGATLTLENVEIRNSKGANGGAVFDAGGFMNLTNVSITGNTATGDGGGLWLDLSQDNLTNVTLSGNHADGNGGGINHNIGPAALQNVTVASNTAGGTGGGIFLQAPNAAMTISNVILANNTATGGNPNCDGTFTTVANTITNDKTGCLPTLAFTVADPKLQGLANNGSAGNLLTLTHAVLKDSPAVDGGTGVGCPPNDQRGATRGTCDVGAFEMVQPNLTVSVNQTSYKGGDTLTMTGSALNDSGTALTVDVYVVFVVPSGIIPGCGGANLVFVTSSGGLSFICGTASPATFPKFLGGFTVPAVPVAGTVFTRAGAAAPKGAYLAIIAFTKVNSLADGAINAGDVINQVATPFFFE
jgi:hypothetical protein